MKKQHRVHRVQAFDSGESGGTPLGPRYTGPRRRPSPWAAAQHFVESNQMPSRIFAVAALGTWSSRKQAFTT